jgi:hypothetical protein
LEKLTRLFEATGARKTKNPLHSRGGCEWPAQPFPPAGSGKGKDAAIAVADFCRVLPRPPIPALSRHLCAAVRSGGYSYFINRRTALSGNQAAPGEASLMATGIARQLRILTPEVRHA